MLQRRAHVAIGFTGVSIRHRVPKRMELVVAVSELIHGNSNQ
jgi:hypothetical protein